QGSKITYEQANAILKNSDVKAMVAQWLADPKQQVFIIGEVLSTTQISVSTKSAWNGDLSFNGSVVSKCANATSSTDDSTKSQPPASASSTSASSTATSSPKTNKTAAASTASTASTKSPAASTMPGGELHFCTSNNNIVTMKTDTPLVFAAAAYKVIKGPGPAGELELQPIFVSPNGGTLAEDNKAKKSLALSAKTAAAVSSNWKRNNWPASH
ncbi:MAG: hypothetical protein WBX22_03090, partial [Silvibacterium sp.]